MLGRLTTRILARLGFRPITDAMYAQLLAVIDEQAETLTP